MESTTILHTLKKALIQFRLDLSAHTFPTISSLFGMNVTLLHVTSIVGRKVMSISFSTTNKIMVVCGSQNGSTLINNVSRLAPNKKVLVLEA
jgi:hypothetical protein